MSMKLHKLIKPELEILKSNCNFDNEEEMVFDLLAKRKSYVQIAEIISVSERTVCRISKRIYDKIDRMNRQ